MKTIVFTLLTCLISVGNSIAQNSDRAEVVLELAMSEGYVPVGDSVRLHYQTVGSGPDTVVVMHGGPGYANYLEPELTPLALSRTLLFYDQRSAGESTMVTDTTQLHWHKYVEDLEMLRQHFGMERLTLMGHSWGGLLAGLYAVEHPERINRLVLLDPGPPPAYEPYFEQVTWTANLDSLNLNRMNLARKRWSETESLQNCWVWMEQFLKTFVADAPSARQAWGDFCNSPQMALIQPNIGYPVASLGLRNYDFRDEIGGIDAPVLLLAAGAGLYPIGISRQYAEALPNEQYVVIEGLGHELQFEDPDQVFPIIEAFLDDNWPVPVEEVQEAWPPTPSSEHNAYERAWWEITAAHDRLESAIQEQDVDLAVQTFTKDARLFVPMRWPLIGERLLSAHFQDLFRKGLQSGNFQTLGLQGDQRTLIEEGRYMLRGQDNVLLDMGKYMAVWKRVDEEWRADRYIMSTSMEKLSSLYEYNLEH